MDVRVCASPGRDKDMRENGGKKLKQGASRKRSASESIGMGKQHRHIQVLHCS